MEKKKELDTDVSYHRRIVVQYGAHISLPQAHGSGENFSGKV